MPGLSLFRKASSWLPNAISSQPSIAITAPVLVSITTIDMHTISSKLDVKVAEIKSNEISDSNRIKNISVKEEPSHASGNNISKFLAFWTLYGGIVMSLSASIFFSTAFLIIKILEPQGVKSFGAALLFNLGVLLPCSLLIIVNEFGPGWKKRGRVLKGIWPLNKETVLGYMMIQGLLQATSVVLRSLSLRTLSVGDMTVIVFSSPVVTTILAHFIVGEEIGLIFILIAIFTLCGVGCVTKPPIFTGAKELDTGALIGSAFAAGAMFTLSMKFVITRKIRDTHFLAMTFFLGLAGTLVSLPLFLAFEDAASIIPNSTRGLMLELGLLSGFGAVASINLALKMEDAGVVALVRSCDVIAAFMLQFIFLGVIPDMLSAIGAVMVWTGVLVAGIRKYVKDKQDQKENNATAVRDRDK